jgi:hypothetical protein
MTGPADMVDGIGEMTTETETAVIEGEIGGMMIDTETENEIEGTTATANVIATMTVTEIEIDALVRIGRTKTRNQPLHQCLPTLVSL